MARYAIIEGVLFLTSELQVIWTKHLISSVYFCIILNVDTHFVCQWYLEKLRRQGWELPRILQMKGSVEQWKKIIGWLGSIFEDFRCSIYKYIYIGLYILYIYIILQFLKVICCNPWHGEFPVLPNQKQPSNPRKKKKRCPSDPWVDSTFNLILELMTFGGKFLQDEPLPWVRKLL